MGATKNFRGRRAGEASAARTSSLKASKTARIDRVAAFDTGRAARNAAAGVGRFLLNPIKGAEAAASGGGNSSIVASIAIRADL